HPVAHRSTDLSGIVREAGGAIASVHIQDMSRHPVAFIGGKIEGRIRHRIDIAIGTRWNTVEITLLSRRPVSADAGLNWAGRDRIHHHTLTGELNRKHLAYVHDRRL